jgi:MOSC domain-containing protein YiiM
MANRFEGRVTEILVAGVAGAPMQSTDAIDAIARRGLEGDRYSLGAGFFSGKPGWGANVTLIESEAIAAINAGHGAEFSAASLRRNLVTVGIKLDTLIGRDFRCGEAILRGTKAFPPCAHLAQLLDNPEILRYLAYCGGIGAEVLQAGTIAVNDVIRRVELIPS